MYEGLFKTNKKKNKEKNNRFDDLNGPTKISDRFRHHQLVYYLMKELNDTDEGIYKRNYISCLNWMAFFYERDKVEQAKQKNNK
jgi:hypothetical protein